jgi:hypothetical protein
MFHGATYLSVLEHLPSLKPSRYVIIFSLPAKVSRFDASLLQNFFCCVLKASLGPQRVINYHGRIMRSPFIVLFVPFTTLD